MNRQGAGGIASEPDVGDKAARETGVSRNL